MASLNGIRWLLLDWGDTLMRVFPESKASMAEWPVVELIPGVRTALPALQKTGFHLALISNAENSNVTQVRKALRRVGIDELIERIYVARELGCRKPEATFFNAVLHDLGCSPSQALVVGDTLMEDVIGAQRAGIQAIWFRPHRDRISDFPLCPCIHHFSELPGCLASLISERHPQ
jgi:HAD superfamily hydrolase (TIGR01662 family)